MGIWPPQISSDNELQDDLSDLQLEVTTDFVVLQQEQATIDRN